MLASMGLFTPIMANIPLRDDRRINLAENIGERGVSPQIQGARMPAEESNKRKRFNRPYPTHTLENVLRIAKTIQEVNAGLPMDRLLLATALGTTSSSSGFRMSLGSSEKYSLTQGGYNDERISLAPLGLSAVSPSSATELNKSLREAATAPEIFRRFYSLLAGSPLLEDVYAENILARELQVRPELTRECLNIIKANGLYAGLLKEFGDVTLVEYDEDFYGSSVSKEIPSPRNVIQPFDGQHETVVSGRIFIGNTRASKTVSMLHETLTALGIKTIDMGITQDGSTGTFNPDVSNLMRQCSLAVIFADGCGDPQGLSNDSRTDQASLVLLGAASMLYGSKVVFVAQTNGETLPLPPGTVTVEYRPSQPEATVLDTIKALGETGALHADVPAR